LIDDIDRIDSPVLVVYLDRIKQNIESLKSMIDDVQRLRPHIKTHKSKDASLLLMEAGINKFKCAAIAEAEMLGSIQAPDVLLAYQPIGPKIDRFISLIRHFPLTRYSCLVDNIISAGEIAKKAIAADIEIPVYIDLNVGMNRTGIKADQNAVDLYTFCIELKGVDPVGLHVYDGHIRDSDPEIRKNNCDDAFNQVEELRNNLLKAGFPEPLIIAGGSPTFSIHAKRKKIECSPGTFIYWDAGYQEILPDQPFLPAALVVSRVISHPDDSIFCTDLGHKSIGPENELSRRVRFINAPDVKFIGQSEEHLVLKTEKEDLKIGDVLYGIPVHVCPTCALYEKVLVIENGKLIGEWRTVARDRKIQI
jgi:D-serine deaminase-like pyridoxal phosphate-dependent protein